MDLAHILYMQISQTNVSQCFPQIAIIFGLEYAYWYKQVQKNTINQQDVVCALFIFM